MDIREALAKLDTMENEHWTADGAPKIDAVKDLLNRNVTRQEITDAAPKFSRENPIIEDEPEQAPEVTESTEEPAEQDRSILEQLAEAGPVPLPDFLALLKDVPSDQLNDLLTLQLGQQQTLIEYRKRVEEMDYSLRNAMVQVRARISREIPDVNNQQAIRDYLKSQQATRAAKHAVTSEILKEIDMKQLDPRSAIDRAMARRTARGTQRPVHPQR